ncbi:MAG: hypothetical protein AAB676_16985 [Verrucomicrobiota bacterium]
MVVTNDRTGATPVFTVATLVPGASADFTGGYTVPANSGCAITSTLTGSGADRCTGLRVTASASSTCPLLTSPAIEVTQTCPLTPVAQGGILTYSGSVRNAGNITLTNIVVTHDRSGATPILTVASLAPGASAHFTGSYSAPASGDATSTSSVSATSLCGVAVINTASLTCAIVTLSGIAVTKLCPPLPVAPGGTLVFTGTVTNTGNVTLTNVFVVNSQPAPNTPVLGPITLAPGAGTSFTGSYLATGGSNPTTNSTIVTNSSGTIRRTLSAS